ncbi:MAG TPA: hypothetical protein VNG71_02675 [Pyrinomonadaceae bacterium]|nr:hypothetical protein [Pyrinomonadaceae bacterium]
MKSILTYRDKDLKQIWKRSNSASRMLLSLRYDLSSIRTGLENFVQRSFEEVWSDDELAQYREDRKTLDTDCKRRILDGEITRLEADRIVAEALWLTAISELQFDEYLDAESAQKLREFIDIRLMLC